MIHHTDRENAALDMAGYLTMFFEYSDDLLCIRSPEGRFVKVNAAWMTWLGYTPAELEGQDLLKFIHPEDVDVSRAQMGRVGSGSQDPITPFVNRYRHRDGSYRLLEWRARQVGDMAIGIARDVTGRMAAEASRSLLLEQFERAQTVAQIGSWETDVPTLNVSWSRETYRLCGKDPQTFFPTHGDFLLVVHPEDRAEVDCAFLKSLKSKGPFSIEHRLLLDDGQVRHVEERWEVQRDSAGDPVRVIGTCQDVSSRNEAARLIGESEERLRLLSQISKDVIWDWDLVSGSIWWSEGFGKLSGLVDDDSERTRNRWIELVHPDDRAWMLNGFEKAVSSHDESWSEQYRVLRGDGVCLAISEEVRLIRDPEGHVVRMVGGITDISNLRQLEEQFRQSQRLEAVGTLTGGVAHDFNNLLTLVIGSTEFLVDSLSDRPDLQRVGRVSLEAADRGAQLVSRLLAFARNQDLNPEVIDCSDLLAMFHDTLRRVIPEDIEITLDSVTEGLRCRADRANLTTAILNLCINARDAMPEGGSLSLGAAFVERPSSDAHSSFGQTDGFVAFTVRDTGEGMPPQVVARACEPFFTTKPVGVGSGLGLSMAYGFVAQSGGRLEIESEVGAGTCITLYLPATTAPLTPVLATRPQPAGARNQHVLVVEDDNLLRDQVERQLLAIGYRVTTSCDGRDAIQKLAKLEDVAVLMTDVVMPGGMNGRQVADHARLVVPSIQVLYTSGHNEDALLRGGGLHGGDEFLPKPYRRADLAAKLAKLLSAAPPDVS